MLVTMVSVLVGLLLVEGVVALGEYSRKGERSMGFGHRSYLAIGADAAARCGGAGAAQEHAPRDAARDEVAPTSQQEAENQIDIVHHIGELA